MKVSLDQEFRRLVAAPRKVAAKRTKEMVMIHTAIWARDYASKSLIPFFGLYFGVMALLNSIIALSLNSFRDHPVRRPAALGGFIGVFGFVASMLWFID